MDEKNDAGTSIPMLFGGIFLFLVIIMIIIEVQNVYATQRKVKKELQIAANIAIVKSMDDEYRIDGVSQMDVSMIEYDFEDYLVDALDLSMSTMEHRNGNYEYAVNILSITPTENPPKLEVGVVVFLKPIFLQGLLEEYVGPNIRFEIPIDIVSKNQRLD
ncbi:MAG: hypothetical protein CVU95_04105 [Firmicutes bacterium HGW-Firmicutes-2]|jgi:hypothetical protein|nr:MAG: hypothetical protein CVU95_04105 [Firmicutes bacterium HGW-Firmicutes-2]